MNGKSVFDLLKSWKLSGRSGLDGLHPFGGLHPFSEDWHAIESLVRALWSLDVAVILLNMPTWCIGETGRREGYVHGHSRCQRMIFNQTRSRAKALPGAAVTASDVSEDMLGGQEQYAGESNLRLVWDLKPQQTNLKPQPVVTQWIC